MKTPPNLFIYCFLIFLLIAVPGCTEESTNIREFNKIVFLSNRDLEKGFNIYTMNPDGSNQINITNKTGVVTPFANPILSPDTQNILFLDIKEKGKYLRLLNLESGEIRTLTEVNSYKPQAVFSPRGDKVVFVKKVDNKEQIFLLSIKDSTVFQNLSSSDINEYHPDFSPDGSKIIFVSRESDSYKINTMNLDGTNKKVIYKQKGKISYPTYSSDGEDITFVGYENDVSALFIVRNHGTGIKKLREGKVAEEKPTFTPDGEKIVFNTFERGMRYRDVCVIGTDGTEYKNLTVKLNYVNQNANITPDGESIIFQSYTAGNCDIYKIDIGSEEIINLTNHPASLDNKPSI